MDEQIPVNNIEPKRRSSISKIFIYVLVPLIIGVILFAVAYTFGYQRAIRSTSDDISVNDNISDMNKEDVDDSDFDFTDDYEKPQSVDEGTTIVGDPLMVAWLQEPEDLTLESYGFEKFDYGKYDYEPPSNFITNVYKVGIVKSEPYLDRDLLIFRVSCYGPCGSWSYRVIDDREKSGLVILKKLSRVLNYNGEEYVASAEKFILNDTFDIPALHVPDKIQIVEGENIFRFEAEPFNPDILLDDFLFGKYKNSSISKDLEHPVLGSLYEIHDSGIFVLALPDGTIKLYRLQFPFETYTGDKYGFIYLQTDVNLLLDNGERMASTVTPLSLTVCPPRKYLVKRGLSTYKSSNDGLNIKKIGTIEGVGDIYEYDNRNNQHYKDIYQWYYDKDKISYDAFVDSHPIVFFKDALNRWMGLLNTNYLPAVETECPYVNSVL